MQIREMSDQEFQRHALSILQRELGAEGFARSQILLEWSAKMWSCTKLKTMPETSTDVIKRYLEDAIAAEKSFETQLQGFANEGEHAVAKAAFHQHALETKQQYERLTARLQSLGGNPSGAKSFLAHIFGLSPKTAQIGHEKEERTTQNLMIAYAVENSEIAMYEALATTAEAAGDTQTAALAREIQAEEQATAEKVWKLIAGSAVQAFERLTGVSAPSRSPAAGKATTV